MSIGGRAFLLTTCSTTFSKMLLASKRLFLLFHHSHNGCIVPNSIDSDPHHTNHYCAWYSPTAKRDKSKKSKSKSKKKARDDIEEMFDYDNDYDGNDLALEDDENSMTLAGRFAKFDNAVDNLVIRIAPFVMRGYAFIAKICSYFKSPLVYCWTPALVLLGLLQTDRPLLTIINPFNFGAPDDTGGGRAMYLPSGEQLNV